MIDYQVAIPSYDREKVICKATIPCLLKNNISPEKITIFVANKQQKSVYEAELKKNNFKLNVVVGVIGLVPQRIFINNFYKKGQAVLSLDDDVYKIQKKNKDGLLDFDGSLDEIVTKGFSICEKIGAKLWGVNPCANGMFMKHEISVGLKYIIGAMFGFYAGDSVWLSPTRATESSGEDFETTILSYKKYKNVVRFEGVTFKTKYFEKGGIESELGGKVNRQINHTEVLKKIASRHSDVASVYQKAGGVTNIRLKRISNAKIRYEV